MSNKWKYFEDVINEIICSQSVNYKLTEIDLRRLSDTLKFCADYDDWHQARNFSPLVALKEYEAYITSNYSGTSPRITALEPARQKIVNQLIEYASKKESIKNLANWSALDNAINDIPNQTSNQEFSPEKQIFLATTAMGCIMAGTPLNETIKYYIDDINTRLQQKNLTQLQISSLNRRQSIARKINEDGLQKATEVNLRNCIKPIMRRINDDAAAQLTEDEIASVSKAAMYYYPSAESASYALAVYSLSKFKTPPNNFCEAYKDTITCINILDNIINQVAKSLTNANLSLLSESGTNVRTSADQAIVGSPNPEILSASSPLITTGQGASSNSPIRSRPISPSHITSADQTRVGNNSNSPIRSRANSWELVSQSASRNPSPTHRERLTSTTTNHQEGAEANKSPIRGRMNS